MTKLRKEIENTINRNNAEAGSDTPDFILAEYLTDCLAAFDKAVSRRSEWYGYGNKPILPPPQLPLPLNEEEIKNKN